MKYYVDVKAKSGGDGSKEKPFRWIRQAAEIAVAGDEVMIAPGVYREKVTPIHPGTKDRPVVYRAAEPGTAVITGAEEIKSWEKVDGTVWKTVIDNALFGSYHPFTTKVEGDWLIPGFAHTGDVYLNHKSLYETETLEGVKNPKRHAMSWDADFSTYTWYAEQDFEKDQTVIYANFQGSDPNREETEISVRRNCFMPETNGINYITVSGLVFREAATQWAPPTAYQDGMIGPHWAKGWIIEDCEIYESKCSGISLGKYLQPDNDNKWLRFKYKDGTQTERDCICQASYEGWDKEHIGSHIVRRCNIHDCGQTGIVGHLGGVFSLIEENHIHHINNKQTLIGAETGGIKMHAAIDVTIRKNHIHHCNRGLWLDWQAQGTRVTRNLFHDNCMGMDRSALSMDNPMMLFMGMGEDIFVEVSHGPTLIDNNVLLSERSLKLATQGVAVVHNLLAGSIAAVGTGTNNGTKGIPSPRYTPYHVPHGTKIAGFMTILHGDCRFYNNLFVRREIFPLFAELQEKLRIGLPEEREWDDMNFECGLQSYDNYPLCEEWEKKYEGYCGMGSEGDPNRYYDPLPVWTGGNVYFNGAKPCKKEKDAAVIPESVRLELKYENGEVMLETDLFSHLPEKSREPITTDTLGFAFEPEQRFENADGSRISFDEDYFGKKREGAVFAGPFAEGIEKMKLSTIGASFDPVR